MNLPVIHFTLTKGSRRKLLRKKPTRRIRIMPSSQSSLFLLTTILDDCMLPTLDAEELAERIQAMRKQESTHHRCDDYMRDSDSIHSFASQTVDEESRIKMCEWCFQVRSVQQSWLEYMPPLNPFLTRALAPHLFEHRWLTFANFAEKQLAFACPTWIDISLHYKAEWLLPIESSTN